MGDVPPHGDLKLPRELVEMDYAGLSSGAKRHDERTTSRRTAARAINGTT
jgi:hypothetical protein